MFLEITTTITSKVPLTDDGLGTPSHAVEIDAEDASALPNDVIYAVVLGGLRSTETSVLKAAPRLADVKSKDGE